MKISYIVLYLNDTTKGMKFWTEKMGYVKKEENQIGDVFVYKVRKEGDYTDFELVPLSLMKDNHYNLNLGIPSIAFETKDLEKEHLELQNKNIKVSEINNDAGIMSFTIFDNEDNAFAVIEKK